MILDSIETVFSGLRMNREANTAGLGIGNISAAPIPNFALEDTVPASLSLASLNGAREFLNVR